MCKNCHIKLSNNFVIEQIKESIENPHFEQWNTTSIDYMLLSLRGLNGEEAHNLSKILIEMFYEWYLGSTQGLWQNFYQYKTGLFPFPHSKELRKMIDDAEEFYKKQNNELHSEQ